MSRDLEPSRLVFSAASDGRVQPVVELSRGLAARQCDPTGAARLVRSIARGDAILDRRPKGDVLP